jgi:sorbitol-specific phosphotransferase system component IIC
MAAVESAAATNCLRETLFQVSVILAIGQLLDAAQQPPHYNAWVNVCCMLVPLEPWINCATVGKS